MRDQIGVTPCPLSWLAPLLDASARFLGVLPRNGVAWSYVIRGADGSPYLTRTLGPRVLGHRAIHHRIWRPDRERALHNHPWRRARFLVVDGWYVEERLIEGRRVRRTLSAGDVNVLDAEDFHRVLDVHPGTRTLGIVGERCQEWGFLVDGEGFVPHGEYLSRQQEAGARPRSGEAR